MIVALLAATAIPVQIVPDDRAEEVVILGRKLAGWRGSARMKDGRYTCRIRQSSGDKQIDAIGCMAMERCMTQVQPKVSAMLATNPSREQRTVLFEPINREMSGCMKQVHDSELERLADRRAAARTE
ncbi:hypothetical protein [Sphingomonas sp. LT1P40]|uniref:hypothetical protein n=1 Tax=Alteristakelama amylovorans TaxID=3096166 RepID=UPI002FCC6F3D